MRIENQIHHNVRIKKIQQWVTDQGSVLNKSSHGRHLIEEQLIAKKGNRGDCTHFECVKSKMCQFYTQNLELAGRNLRRSCSPTAALNRSHHIWLTKAMTSPEYWKRAEIPPLPSATVFSISPLSGQERKKKFLLPGCNFPLFRSSSLPNAVHLWEKSDSILLTRWLTPIYQFCLTEQTVPSFLNLNLMLQIRRSCKCRSGKFSSITDTPSPLYFL